MSSNISIALLFLTALPAAAQGSYPTEVGTPGTTAIHKDSPLFVNWASGHSSCTYGTGVDAVWQVPANGYGKATGGVYDIVCLGNGGRITMVFPHPIRDGSGWDFAVFENAFDDFFLELAFVEVSSDGVNFFRFPTASLTPGPVGAFGSTVYPENIDGFAGKYRGGYGTPFDLAILPNSPLLDKQNIRHVRLVDIIGDGKTKDSSGRPIYDPTPTVGSGGFDLDAIGVIHQNAATAIPVVQSGLTQQGFLLKWQSNPGSTYRIETTTDFKVWQAVETLGGSNGATTERILPVSPGTNRFWRVARP